MRYSFIVPVYNRPDEVDELLQSLTKQTLGDFEVLVIEDGSSVPCEDVVEKYRTLLDVHYYNKPNSGPGQTRNFGTIKEYLIICIFGFCYKYTSFFKVYFNL
jgi:glycosyltransferase involved in cell wall biosynthesis